MRLSSREIWSSFLIEREEGAGRWIVRSRSTAGQSIKQRDRGIVSQKQLDPLESMLHDVRSWAAEWSQRVFVADLTVASGPLARSHELLHAHLEPRGLLKYVEADSSIVRGLGLLTREQSLEVFDRGRKERAPAGGGRYDELLAAMSDGKISARARICMGDVVLANLIDDILARSQQDGELDRAKARC